MFFASNSRITYFNNHFPLPHNESWREFHIITKWVSRVIECLHGKQFQMVWLQRLPKITKNNVIIGVTTPISAQYILSSPTSPALSNTVLSLQHLLLGSSQACTEKILQLKFTESRTLPRPYPRPSKWLESLVPSTGKKANTS